MNNFHQIQQKLKQFSSKYYTNELIKGTILFVALGLLYLLFTLFIEYFLWLKPTARTLLFWGFIAVELFLLIRFIGFPLFKLFGLKQGISTEEASKIIGNHFPEVKDKLLNVLQLQQNSTQSDLLLASIEQKANELQPIPFTKAIDFSTNTKYLKYAFIPVVIWLLTLFTGANKDLTKSFQRVVNHSVAYNPPAPFSFSLTNPNLQVIQGKPLTVYVEAKGEVIPEEAKILYKNQQYFLQNESNGLFSYTFSEVNNPTDFYVEANGIQSQEYHIDIIKTPTIQNVSMQLIYPKYLGKRNETLPNTGNITVPQGTTIQWDVKTTQANSVTFINEDKRIDFKQKENNNFSYAKRILQNINYQIATSNKELKDYEQLQFSVDIIKDENPTISVKSNIDSISRGTAYFAGQIADDNGISSLELVYYNKETPQIQQKKVIKTTTQNIQTFFYEFPNTIALEKGINYELFFQVYDNDAVNGQKKATSKKFSYRQKTTTEIKEELLQEQKNYINNLENSLNKQQKSKNELEKIQFDLQNKKSMNWNDQKKIKKLIERQQQYKKMMQRQTKKLQENFSEKKEASESLEEKKEALKKRIEELKKIKKQEKLLDELMKMAEKLNKDELIKKTKELAEQNKQQERSLERILELTKRFYVEQKMTQIANKLENLAKKQLELTKKETTKEDQKAIKEEFNKLKEEMKTMQQENKKLKKPMDIPKMQAQQSLTQKELNKAQNNLAQQKKNEAKKNQKKAAKMMQEMSKQMQQQMSAMSTGMEEENEKDLRKILKNLLIFSFEQEALMTITQQSSVEHPNFGKNLKKQHQLKTYFEHIDDSLFVISMRSPMISSKIQDQLAIAHYNLDQSLENLSDNRFNQGTTNQQYVMTAANSLADMLSSHLNAMKSQQMGSGKGKGKGESFSLPDIIKKQDELLKKMKDGMGKKTKQGKQQKGKNGEEKKDGNGKKNGDSGEKMNGELYKIFQEQSLLREQLQNAIKKGKNGNGQAKKALKEMEELENNILNKGFNEQTIQKMQQLKYNLLKLDKATFEQGKEDKRKATTNYKDYNQNNAKLKAFKKLFYNQTEILNRQSLPLRQNYKKKVQEYFKNEK